MTLTSLAATVAPRTGKIIENGPFVRNRVSKLEFKQTKNGVKYSSKKVS